jgi:hypothetical protein
MPLGSWASFRMSMTFIFEHLDKLIPDLAGVTEENLCIAPQVDY